MARTRGVKFSDVLFVFLVILAPPTRTKRLARTRGVKFSDVFLMCSLQILTRLPGAKLVARTMGVKFSDVF